MTYQRVSRRVPLRRAALPRSVATAEFLQDGGLGFSLKPSKKIRKAFKKIKKAVTLKRVLVGGAIVGSMFIPGVAPVVARAGGLLLRGAGKGARLLTRGAGKVVRFAGREVFTGWKGRQAPAPVGVPTVEPAEFPGPIAIAPQLPAPVFAPPEFTGPSAPSVSSAPAGYGYGGGGGAAEAAEPQAEGQAPSDVGARTGLEAMPTILWIIGGVVVLALAGGVWRRRTRRI